MQLKKILGLYVTGFVLLTVTLAILEFAGVLKLQGIGYVFMIFSVAVYAMIGIITRTSDPSEYYVAGRGVSAIYNGMATGSDWMSAASFISMAGLLFALGHMGLAYILGWTGGYVLLALLLAPYLRKFGQYTVPDFLGTRYGGNAARVIGIICAILVSLTYLTAQLNGVGTIVSRFIGIPFEPGVFIGLLGVLVCSFLGGMRAVTWTQVAQYIVLISAYLIPVVWLSAKLFVLPIPELTYGKVLERISVMEKQIMGKENPNPNNISTDVLNDKIDAAKEKESRDLWAKDVAMFKAKLSNVDSALSAEKAALEGKIASLSENSVAERRAELEKQKAEAQAMINAPMPIDPKTKQPVMMDAEKMKELEAKVADAEKQLAMLTPERVKADKEKAEKALASLPKNAEEAKTKWTAAQTAAANQAKGTGDYLATPALVSADGKSYPMLQFLGLILCLMVGTAGLPHILTRYYTTPSVKQARSSVGWSLFFIFLLYFTAPAYAAFARYEVFVNLVGVEIANLPSWIASWKVVGLLDVIDKNGDGIVQFADFIIKSTDFVVLATPEIAGLPATITGLVMAGGLAAALSTADGLLLTIANAFSHDLYYKIINPSASVQSRVLISKILLVVVALIGASIAAFVKLPVIAATVAWAFSFAASSLFPALVLGIWWRRTTGPAALLGMVVGLAVSMSYSISNFFYQFSILSLRHTESGLLGMTAAFLVIIIVSLITPAPDKALQDFVYSVRFPKGAAQGKEVESIGGAA
ncbi:MAG: VC_2705 family sodium/solute symporter [Chloroherpetonaceae bacterium]